MGRWLVTLLPVRWRVIEACNEAAIAVYRAGFWICETDRLKYIANAPGYVREQIARGEVIRRLGEIAARAEAGIKPTPDELKFIRAERRQGRKIERDSYIAAWGGVVAVRIWAGANAVNAIGVLVAVAKVTDGHTSVGVMNFYLACSAIFPLLLIAGFVELAAGSLFVRRGTLARILGFTLPAVSGLAVCLSALFHHTSHPWMTNSVVRALVLTIGFLVFMFAARAFIAFTKRPWKAS